MMAPLLETAADVRRFVAMWQGARLLARLAAERRCHNCGQAIEQKYKERRYGGQTQLMLSWVHAESGNLGCLTGFQRDQASPSWPDDDLELGGRLSMILFDSEVETLEEIMYDLSDDQLLGAARYLERRHSESMKRYFDYAMNGK